MALFQAIQMEVNHMPNLEENKKESIENKQKKASERFLDLMKKVREDELKKEKLEESKKNLLDNSINVSAFVSNISTAVSKVFNKVNMWLDAMLASSKRIRLLSLFMALTLCYFVNGGSGISTTKSIDFIYEVPVEVLCDDGYEVTGYAETVTVQLVGDYGSIQWAKMMKNYSIVVDATGKTVGNYQISYRPEGFSSSLEIKVVEETANVNISKKQTRTFALGYHFVNLKEMDSTFTLKEPQLAFLEVDVTAGETTLDKIDRVVAKIDVAKLEQPVRNGEAPIVALDSLGNELNVEIEPKKVLYDLDVVSFSKVVPVRVEVQGAVNSGFHLMEVIPSITHVTIYGLEEDLEGIEEVVAIVDVKGRTTSGRMNGIALVMPDHVSKLSDKTISVDLELEEIVERKITDIPIQFESLPNHLNAKLIGDTKVSVHLRGPKSKVNAIMNTNLVVYVDLTEAKVGTASYDLKIVNQDPDIKYEWIGTSSVDVVVMEN